MNHDLDSRDPEGGLQHTPLPYGRLTPGARGIQFSTRKRQERIYEERLQEAFRNSKESETRFDVFVRTVPAQSHPPFDL